MSDYLVGITKEGYNVLTETDPNNYIFHSLYNTFKLLKTGLVSVRLLPATSNQSFSFPHYLPFTPLVLAFAKPFDTDNVIAPNGDCVIGYFTSEGAGALFTDGYRFLSFSSDATNVTFNFSSSSSVDRYLYIRYFCYEII